jgi:diguanylate cyclase (GGDEF)-like protein
LERALPALNTRLGIRIRGDTQLLLAIAVAIPVFAVEGISENPRRALGLLAPIVFVGAQLWLTTLRTPPRWLTAARLAMCLSFIAMANVWVDPSGTWPLSALAIPVVALAAANGGRGGVIVAVGGLSIMLVPLALTGLDVAARQSVFAVAMAALALGYGSRRVVVNLERQGDRLRRANLRARRHASQLAAVESVGSLLAREGPTAATLDRVMGVLEDTFGYRYPSVYVWDGTSLQLGAQRNYRFPIQTVEVGQGILGRIVRTREAAFLPDARSDPDFLSADPEVVSEISIPLQSDGELLGVLNVETNGARRLDDDDFGLMQIVADRLAAALALGRERQKLTERAALLDGLAAYSRELRETLDPAAVHHQVVAGAARVVAAGKVSLTLLDRASGRFHVASVEGVSPALIGLEIVPGDGLTGRAIRDARVVVEDRLERASFARAAAAASNAEVISAMSAPLIVDGVAVGALTWARDIGAPFSSQEREVAGLLAAQAGLVLANAELHRATALAAVTDPLTGLPNRRHFDAEVEHDDAVRRRVPAERRSLRSVILFDLDHFGQVNKRYGHQVGDRVLRLFADTLRARARASDLVARYGGEEFVVILENASRDDATVIAEDVRTAFATQRVETVGGDPIRTTVSAGCATLEAWEIEGSLLLERADVALAMAKQAGRNQVVAA